MDRSRIDRRQCVIAAVAAALASPAGAQGRAAGIVTNLSGRAEAELEAVVRQLRQDASVFVGDRISTGPDARTRIALGEATELRLGPGGRIRIDRFLMRAGGVIDIEAGAVLLDKDPSRASGPINLRSSFGLIAVRGTRVFAGPSNGVFGVFVERGSVEVSAAGKRVVLRSGQGADIARPGSQPTDAAAWGNPRIQRALRDFF
jgi:ferric-dicitrate binding protein FerR (iron transport regulator)